MAYKEGRPKIKVDVLDLNKNLVATFPSIKLAAIYMGVSASNASQCYNNYWIVNKKYYIVKHNEL